MARFINEFSGSKAVGSGGLALAWLTLALQACNGQVANPDGSGGAGVDNSGGKGSGGRVVSTDGGRSSGGSSSGGGANPTGGSSDGGAGGGGPTVQSLVHEDGLWLVKFGATEGFYSLSCSGTDPRLVETDPPKGATTLPPYGEYFLDGAYVNIPINLGCDFRQCVPFPSQTGISDQGVVSVGTLPGEGGAGGAGPEIPAFEHYTIDGPFVFTNRYYTDSNCTNLVTEDPQDLTP